MPDDNSKKYSNIVNTVAGIGDSSLGSGLGQGLIYLGLFLGMALVVLGGKWDGHLYDRKGCVDIKKIDGSFYKVDTCDAKIKPEKINIKDE